MLYNNIFSFYGISVMITAGMHFSFVLATSKKKTITFYKRFNWNNSVIMDNHFNTYKIGNCFWYLCFNKQRIWNNLEENCEYEIYYYGCSQNKIIYKVKQLVTDPGSGFLDLNI